MLALTLNPGFVPMLAALLVLATPRQFRSLLMVASALAALWLLLDHEFGAAAAMAQMGLPVVLLNIDALNRIFGIALMIALIAVGIFSGARRNRYEDAAILLLAGCAISALFVGDLISFVAAAALGGLAAAWVVFASPLADANRAGVRLLVWHGLEGLLFLVGVAFHLASGAGSSVIGRLDAGSLGGAFIFAALMIRAGAPFAHVWLKDVVSHASPAGGAALSSFTTMLGVYALARFFPSEPLLLPIGGAMIVIGALYVAAETDLRRAAAYGMTMQTGVCLALIGSGTPLALAAAEGHAFTAIIGFLALQLVLGAFVERTGGARLSDLNGVARQMPISAMLLLASGLAASAAPGFASYATHAVALEASAQWDLRWLWTLVWVTPAILFVSLALRASLVAFAPAPARVTRMQEAPFTMLLGAGLALFFCLSVGLAPRWLYDLMPADLAFQPFSLDRVAPQFQMLGAAGVVFLGLHAFAAPFQLDLRVLDVDAFYRGPVASAGRWAGILTLRVYGAWQNWLSGLGDVIAKWVAAAMRACDRPYRNGYTGAVQFFCLSLVLLIMFLTQ